LSYHPIFVANKVYQTTLKKTIKIVYNNKSYLTKY
jgi:hypothetical protein